MNPIAASSMRRRGEPARSDPIDRDHPVAPSLWTSLRYFNVYRLIVAAFLAVLGVVNPAALGLGDAAPRLFVSTSFAYMAATALMHVVVVRLRRWFSMQLALHVAADILAITLLMYASVELRNGLGIMLLISLAVAAMLADRRLTLLFASVATIAVLVEQWIGFVRSSSNNASLFQGAILGVAYFVTALITNWLAQLVLKHEDNARRQAIELNNQERINALVMQDTHDGIVVVSDDGIVRQVNKKAEQLLGQQFWEDRHVGEYSSELADMLDSWRRAPSAEPIRLEIHRSGVRVRARCQAVGDADRMSALVFLEDLSALEAEAQSVKLVALGRLTANIAHEIRNPLSAITHGADLMMEEKRAESRERLARIIRDNALRLDRMVKDVLELNRRDRVQTEEIALDSFLATFLDDYVRNENLSSDAIALQGQSGLSVQFDRVHLHQILWNLVRNGWRFGSQRPGSVVIRRLSVGTRVELLVVDDGPGVPAEIRAQLFEPFFTTDSRGTGLGLYISRELASANGAQLDYQPAAAGSVFRLYWQGAK